MANKKYENALNAVEQKVPPIWMMRQAGRYQKTYRALREKHSFVELCKKPELACEVAMLPINESDFDVAILFSDILFPVEALGIPLDYAPGPKFEWHLNEGNFNKLLPWQDAVEKLQFQSQAVRLTREALPADRSLIGFVGGPFTLFTYAVENEHKGNLIQSKTNFALYEKFSELIGPLLVQNIASQLEAGAEVVMIFDTAAGELSFADFERFVVPLVRKISDAHPGKIGYFAKAAHGTHVELIRKHCASIAGFGYDYRWDMTKAFGNHGKGFYQGNFDPALLFLPKDEFKQVLNRYIDSIKSVPEAKRAGWVCGLGHGILPKTPEENVRIFVDTIREQFA